jgi:hypothetical protein
MFSKREYRQNKWAIRISFVLGFIAIFVIACSPEISFTPTINILPTQTQLSRTVTPISSKTPGPSLTPRPTSTITATPTIDRITALASEFNVPAVCLITYLVSNDQNWIAAHCPLSKELIIANKSTGKKIILPYQEIEKEVPTYFAILPLSWSSDNRYLYFTTRCCNYFLSDSSNGSLYRFDIERESWSILVHAVYEPFYFFSDDGERYVYLNHYPLESSGYPEELEIGMVDFLSNKSKRVVLKYYWGPLYETPEYTWSSNGDEFSIILQNIVAIHPHTIDFKEVLLKIDFKHWNMELVE